MSGAVEAHKPGSKWPALGLLFVITLAVYLNSFWLGLAQDSAAIIGQDPRLRAVTPENLGLILTKNYWWPLGGDGLYRPVATASLLFNYAVLGNGQEATGYHVINFLLHAINVWLLYELALLIFRRTGPSFFAAAIWAVHPAGTEAVTNIVGRADLLAAMSVLGGLLLYVRGLTRWAPLALFVVAALGVFSKENAAVLIGLMLLWEMSFGEGQKGLRIRWRSYAAVVAALAVLVSVRFVILRNLAPYNPIYVDNPLRLAGFWTARWTAIKVIGLDLKTLLWPVSLLSDHSFNDIQIASGSDSAAWISLLAVFGVLGVAVSRYRRERTMFWAAGFFAIALLPTSNLLFLIGSPFAERFLYLPAIGFAVAVAALVYSLKSDELAKGLLIALIAIYGVRTIARNPAWDDDASLASADLPSAPRSFRLHYMLSRALYAQDAAGNIDRAIAEGEEACRILRALPPSRSIAFPATYLGVYYATKADLAGSEERSQWLEKSLASLLQAREISQALERDYDQIQFSHGGLRVRNADQQLYLALGKTYFELGRYREAAEALRYAKEINPTSLDVYDGLTLAYSTIGDWPMAARTIEEKFAAGSLPMVALVSLREVYQKIPDGQCAFLPDTWQLNLSGCPQVKADLCAAYADLAESYRKARVPEGARWAASRGQQRYGCEVR